ncbi:hypothetical protein Hanom_Chr05g00386211 [Helianthus anomalus]
MKMASFQTFWIHMQKNKPLDKSRKTDQTSETMLDQLSLFGKRITTNLVNELVKVLELVELAMSSNIAETVKRARELMDLGVDPMVLMSQMATLIMDIIAGTYQVVEARYGDSLFGSRSSSGTKGSSSHRLARTSSCLECWQQVM